MARLRSTGFELNSLTVGVEFENVNSTGGSISTSTTRSGTYTYRSQEGTFHGSVTIRTRSGDGTQHLFVRGYFRVAAVPNDIVSLLNICDNSNNTRASIRLNNNRTLELWNSSAQVGSDSSALSLNQWYRLELEFDNSTSAGSHVINARIDGVTFASSTSQTLGSIDSVHAGVERATGTTGWDVFVDDIAINDSSGTFQNSWPGEGKIIHLWPNAPGDNADWGQVGAGTANWESLDEIPPDDTNYNDAADLGDTDDLNITSPVMLGTDDTINCVQVGLRFRISVNVGTDPTVALRIKALSGGTVEESSAITFNTTTWNTNAVAAPRNYPFTLYDLPGASTTAWTKSDLESAQIGYRCTNEPASDLPNISTLWLLVDYTPATDSSTTLETLAGSVAANTTTGTQEIVTGLSWTPKAVILTTNDLTADGSATTARLGFGMTAHDGSTMALAVNHLDGAATMDADRYVTNAKGLALVNNSQTVIWDAQVFTTSDGFGINITTTDGVARIINYYVVGGSDVTNATVKQFTTATSTGTQAITGVGFDPDFLLIASNNTSSTPPAANTAGLFMLGMGTSPTARGVMAFNMGNGGGNAIEEKTQVTDKIFHQSNGGSTFQSADLDSLDADGFTLDWTTAQGAARAAFALCLKGGNYAVGTITQPTSTGNQSVSSLGFTPNGVLIASFNEAATASIVEEANTTIGAASSSSARWTVWVGSEDNAADATTDQNLDRTQVWKSITPNSLSLEASADFVSNDSDGFTLNFDAADATQRQLLYWASGNPAGGASIQVDAGVQSLATSQPAATVTAIRNVTISPTAQSLTTSQPSPTVTAIRHASVSPVSQDLTASQAIPAVSISESVTANVQSLTTSQPAPTVTAIANASINAAAQSLTTSQPAIAVSINESLAQDVQTLSVTQPSPTVTVIRNATTSPDAQVLTTFQASPTVTTTRHVTASPGSQVLTTAQVDPTVSVDGNITVSPLAQFLTVAQETPTLSVGESVTPAAQEVALSQPSPTISTVRSVSVAAGVQSLTTSQADPLISTLAIFAQTLSLSLPDPTITTVRNVSIAADVQPLTASIVSPSLVIWNPGWEDGSGNDTTWTSGSADDRTWTDVDGNETTWT